MASHAVFRHGTLCQATCCWLWRANAFLPTIARSGIWPRRRNPSPGSNVDQRRVRRPRIPLQRASRQEHHRPRPHRQCRSPPLPVTGPALARILHECPAPTTANVHSSHSSLCSLLVRFPGIDTTLPLPNMPAGRRGSVIAYFIPCEWMSVIDFYDSDAEHIFEES